MDRRQYHDSYSKSGCTMENHFAQVMQLILSDLAYDLSYLSRKIIVEQLIIVFLPSL